MPQLACSGHQKLRQVPGVLADGRHGGLPGGDHQSEAQHRALLLPDTAAIHQPQPPGPGRPGRPAEPAADHPGTLVHTLFNQKNRQLFNLCGFQMLADLNRVDFANVQEQASWVCGCDLDTVSKLEESFKATLQQQVGPAIVFHWFRLKASCWPQLSG